MIQETYNNPFVTKADFDSLKKTTEDGFILVDDKLIKTDKKFDYMTEAMMGNFDRVYDRFNKIDGQFNEVRGDLDLIKKSLTGINQHLGIKDATISA